MTKSLIGLLRSPGRSTRNLWALVSNVSNIGNNLGGLVINRSLGSSHRLSYQLIRRLSHISILALLTALADGGMVYGLPLETPKPSGRSGQYQGSAVTTTNAPVPTNQGGTAIVPRVVSGDNTSNTGKGNVAKTSNRGNGQPKGILVSQNPLAAPPNQSPQNPPPQNPPNSSPKPNSATPAPKPSGNVSPTKPTPAPTSNQPPKPAPSRPTTPAPQAPQVKQPTLIPVRQIRVVGSTILTESEIRALTAPLEGKSVTINQLREVADKITQIYQERNYITSRAIIPADQVIRNGVVTIQVLEGALENVEIRWAGNDRGRLNEDYIRQRVLSGAKTPLNFSRLEEDLQLLRSEPLIGDLRANLTRSTTNAPDKSVIQLVVTEAPSFSTRAFIDNYGSTTTGIFRLGLGAQELNLTGAGDALSANYTRSGTANAYSFGYTYPVSHNGGTLSLNASFGNNPISDPQFAGLNIATDSQVYELAYRQPLVRTTREEFALGLSFSAENSASTFNGQSFNFQNQKFSDGTSQARVFRFTQEYVERDNQGAWALRSSFNLGVDAFGATVRTDGTPDGRFFSWNGQVLRVQRVSADRDSLLSFRLNTQFTGDRLMALNRFSVGGMYSVRGYRQNQLTGDSGIQGSIEWQMPLVRDNDGVSIVKILPFIESGVIWNTRGVPTNPTPQVLASVGTGLIYQPMKNLTLRLDYGLPLVDAKNPGTNLQDSGLYFSVNGSF
jgi:hemolysin activation/secretion protein